MTWLEASAEAVLRRLKVPLREQRARVVNAMMDVLSGAATAAAAEALNRGCPAEIAQAIRSSVMSVVCWEAAPAETLAKPTRRRRR